MTLIRVLKNNKGSIVFEASFCLLLLTLVIGVNLELIRRAYYETVLQQGTFQWVRDRALGLSQKQAKLRLESFLLRAFERGHAEQIYKGLDVKEGEEKGGVSFYYRYPSFYRFLQEDGNMKHHFEVTKKCLFPF